MAESMTSIPTMTKEGGLLYRRWYVTPHAITRYLERFRGDLGNMVQDIDSSWLVTSVDKFTTETANKLKDKSESRGRYAITNGKVVFVVEQIKRPTIITAINARHRRKK